MSLTWFAPIFLLLMVYACRGERQWVAATCVASFFQAASPLLLTAGGRLSGIQPAYLLLPIGMVYFFIHTFQPHAASDRQFRINSSHLFLIGLTAISILGAIILPRVFGGLVHVLPPRGGIPVMLYASSGNIIQAFYVACNSTLFVLVAAAVYRGSVSAVQSIRYLVFGTFMAALLGVYQVVCNVVHLPWPSVVFNSNLGAAQLSTQVALGPFRRMSSTFLEPSMLAMHFLGMFALFAVGMRSWAIGAVVLFCLLVSTSSTAYVGLCAIALVWIIYYVRRNGISMRNALMFCLLASLVCIVFITHSFGTHDWSSTGYLSQKLSSHSGQVRMGEEAVGVQTIVESWGLGVGVGSSRASSFLTTSLACTGIFGIVCLFGFFGTLIVKAVDSSIKEVRSLGLALTALFIGWLISVPDLAMPMIWLISGVVAGALSRLEPDGYRLRGSSQASVLAPTR